MTVSLCIANLSLRHRLECPGEFDDTDGIRPVVERKSLGAWVHVESLLRVEIGAGGMEAALDLRSHGAFDFDGRQFSARKREKKVHLGPVGSSIVVCLGSVRRCGDQSLNNKTLPGLTNDRMTEQSFLIPNAEQRMRYAAIAHVDLGRLDEPFANIPVPGR